MINLKEYIYMHPNSKMKSNHYNNLLPKMFVIGIIKRIPLIISTIYKHFKYGPPQPSWSLTVHLTVTVFRSFASPEYGIFTIEDVQGKYSFSTCIVPSDHRAEEMNIPHEYRINAQAYIEKLVKPYSIAIDPIWKTPRDSITGDIFMSKDWNEENDWTKEKIVIFFHGGSYFAGNSKSTSFICCKLSKESGARVLSINYRLAPQNPFPAALCDALATYLYLMDPPKNSVFKPYKPEQIVLCGESAGGGLTISLGLALRDLGLPLPAGIIGLVCLIGNENHFFFFLFSRL
jgi:hypothetical protein